MTGWPSRVGRRLRAKCGLRPLVGGSRRLAGGVTAKRGSAGSVAGAEMRGDKRRSGSASSSAIAARRSPFSVQLESATLGTHAGQRRGGRATTTIRRPRGGGGRLGAARGGPRLLGFYIYYDSADARTVDTILATVRVCHPSCLETGIFHNPSR